MSHCTNCSYTKLLISHYSGCCIYTAYKAGSCSPYSSIRSLSTSSTKFHNNRIPCCTSYSVSLCSNKRLEVNAYKKHCLHYLSLDNWRCNCNDRNIWIYNSSLRNCLNSSCEFKILKIIKEAFIEHISATKVLDIIICKLKPLYIVNQHLKTSTYYETATIRISSIEHIENSYLVFISSDIIAICHSQLIIIH